MAEYNLIGTDIVSPDLVAKITGRAKYAEDFRAEGMLFTKLLVSPLPHARVVSIDTSAALALPGVVGILTADEVPQDDYPFEACLTNHPRYEGEPILAVAAVDEMTAADAIGLIKIEFEPLPFVINPLDSLRPGGPNASDTGNVYAGREIAEFKWDQSVFDAAGVDGMPMGPVQEGDEWEYGEGGVEAGFARADVIVEEPIYSHSASHHPLESRSAMAYWQNGKLFINCSVQSTAQSRRGLADRLGMPFEDVIYTSEYCGGGFGSKIRGSVQEVIPALLSKKLEGRPVQMRVTRNEETAFGRARPGMQGWAKMGFRRDGRMTAFDLFIVQDTGPYARQGDAGTAADCASLVYTPESMRFRTVTVLTNTPPRAAQRGPGGSQGVPMFEPLVDRAARQLGMDRLAIRQINGPNGETKFGRASTELTSCHAPEALARGAELFNWAERSSRSGQRNGSKVTGVGIGFGTYYGGTSGWDGLLVIRPDGKLYIHQGVGNLGTHSVMDTARAAPEVLGVAWENCEVVWGASANHLPHSSTSSGSQTTHAHTRANHAVGMAMYSLLQELASLELGGSPSSYAVGNSRVYRIGSPGTGLTFAQAAERAIRRGGKFSGEVLPEDINEMTRNSATALAGQGLIAAAKDNYPHTKRTYSFVITFAEVEVDVETGMHEIKEVTTVADCGTVVHPRSLAAQANAGVIQGLGFARSMKWSIDPTWGVHLTKRLEAAKPPTMLDIPRTFTFAAVDIADPQNPVGAKGIGEPPVGAGSGALLCAIEDALGGTHSLHTPVSPDKIVSVLNNDGRFAGGRLAIHV
jgi:xanthine dehydrogenase molybdenum-binding subunit